VRKTQGVNGIHYTQLNTVKLCRTSTVHMMLYFHCVCVTHFNKNVNFFLQTNQNED